MSNQFCLETTVTREIGSTYNVEGGYDERGLPKRNPGVVYEGADGDNLVLRLETPEVIKQVSDFVYSYMDRYPDGYELTICSEDVPVQVQFYFDGKDVYPEVNEAYSFFTAFNNDISDLVCATVLLSMSADDISKYSR